MRARGLAALAAAALVGLAGVAVAPATPALAEGGRFERYVALGDSVASGHGLGTTVADPCRRSAADVPEHRAYPDDVRDFLLSRGELPTGDGHYLKRACSGTTAFGLLVSQVPDAEAFLGDAPGLVTITVGANDFHFSDASLYGLAFLPLTYRFFTIVRGFEAAFTQTAVRLALVRLGRGHPGRLIAVTSYYNPFNAHSAVEAAVPFVDCAYPQFSRPPCAQVLSDTVGVLNAALAAAVAGYAGSAQDARVVFVDGLAARFAGHEAPKPYCGSAPPSGPDSYIQAPAGPIDPRSLPTNGGDCVHPNATGHLQIADLIETRLTDPG